MNFLLYLHENIQHPNNFYEIIDIVSSWKIKFSKIKLFIVFNGNIDNTKKIFNKWEIEKLFLLTECNAKTPEEIFPYINNIVKKEKIHAILMQNSIFDKELAPYIASIYNWDFIPNIIDFSFKKKKILWKRFLYGTKAIEESITKNKYFVATFTSNIYKDKYKNIKEKIVNIKIVNFKKRELNNFELISSEEKTFQKHPLEIAKIVIGVGKGIKNKENFVLIEQLAEKLEATIGVTRSVVDNGWRPEYEKIGQTGKIIKPELYLGFGISGAMQHMTGVQQSRHIIMINNNPNAEAFRYSDLGIVADLFEVIPNLIKLLNKIYHK